LSMTLAPHDFRHIMLGRKHWISTGTMAERGPVPV
jgi:hypothetical protein